MSKRKKSARNRPALVMAQNIISRARLLPVNFCTWRSQSGPLVFPSNATMFSLSLSLRIPRGPGHVYRPPFVSRQQRIVVLPLPTPKECLTSFRPIIVCFYFPFLSWTLFLPHRFILLRLFLKMHAYCPHLHPHWSKFYDHGGLIPNGVERQP